MEQKIHCGLPEQEKSLKESGADKIFIDSFTGAKLERPEFDKDLITRLIDRGITVSLLILGILSNSSVGTLMRMYC